MAKKTSQMTFSKSIHRHRGKCPAAVNDKGTVLQDLFFNRQALFFFADDTVLTKGVFCGNK
ncbi:MAG: hypothetical protein WKF88_02955 [Ferruginibacter sp.]